MVGIPANKDFVTSPLSTSVYIILASTGAVALLVAYFNNKSSVTVRVEDYGISYSRGGNPQWLSAAWNDIRLCPEKSRMYRGTRTYWIEIEFKDGREILKISQATECYLALRDLLQRMLHASQVGVGSTATPSR